MKYALAALPLLLVGCQDQKALPPAQTPFIFTMNAQRWAFQSSPSMPTQPMQVGDEWKFDFPKTNQTDNTQCNIQMCPSVHYLVMSGNGYIRQGQSIRLAWDITTQDNAQFLYKLKADNNCESPPATMSLYLKRRGGDLTATYENWRWFNVDRFLVKSGPGQATIALEPQNWIQVFGKNGSTLPTAFQSALADVEGVGVVFGGGCFAGHGINIDTGAASFTMKEFGLQ